MILHEYETIYIAKPEIADDYVRTISEKLEGIVGKFQGHILIKEDWGKRKLAYPVKKNAKGHFMYLNYLGPSDLVLEIERNLRIEDNLLRFLTVKLAMDVDVDAKRVEAQERIARQAEAAAQRASEDYDDEDVDLDDLDMDEDS